MTDLERFCQWLQTYPRINEMPTMKVDYTDSLPGIFGVFPAGLVEVGRTEDVLGNVKVRNQYNYALYMVLSKSPGDNAAAQINEECVMDFQRWVQAQSVTHQAPTFGNYEQSSETMSAQNGTLYEASKEGLSMYMVQISASFTDYYKT